MGDSKADAGRVHRLSEMLVEEVSLVDRPANRRKFLLVKRDTAMGQGAQVTAKPDGSYTAAGGGGAPPAPNSNAPPPATDSTPRAKATITLTDDAKAAMQDVLDGVASMLADALDLVKGAKKVDPPDPENPDATEPMQAQPLLDLVGEALGELEDAVYATFGLDDDEVEPPPADGAEPGVPPGPGPVTAAAPPPLAKRLEVLRAKRVITKAEAARVGRDLLAKYGVRMKKERLARFQNAIDALVSIASEVMSAGLGKARKPPPPAKDDENPKGKAKTTKADTGAAPVAVDQHPAFVALQKQLKAATEKLAAIEKSVTPSNAGVVNGRPNPAGDASSVSWPLDMNDDRFRDKNDPDFFGP